MYGLTLLYWLIFLCACKSILVSISVLQVSSIVIMKNCRIVLVPFIGIAFITCFMIIYLVGFALLISTGDISIPTDGTQMKGVSFDDEKIRWFLAAFLFGFLWIFELISAIF